MRQPRIGGAHRRDQGIDHFALDTVIKMARIGDVGKAAPAVGDFLVLGERIGDQREVLHVFRKRLGQRLRGGLALRPGAVLHQIKRRLDGERFAQHLETQLGDGCVELPVPGRIAGHRFFVKQLLDAILELIRPVTPHVFEPRPVMAERRVGHRRIENRVVDAVELEREEQKMRGSGRHPVLHVAVKFGARRIERVAGMNEPGIGAEPAHQIVDRLVTAHRRGKRRAAVCAARHGGELAFVSGLEVDAFGVDAVKVALDGRIVEAGIKVVEIPFRQFAERRFATGRGTPGRALGDSFLCHFCHFRSDLRGSSCGPAGRLPQGVAKLTLAYRAGANFSVVVAEFSVEVVA